MERRTSDYTNSYTKEDAIQSLSTIQGWITAMDAKASYAMTFVGVLIGFMLGSEDRKFDISAFVEKIKEAMKTCTIEWSELLFFALCFASFITIVCFLEVLVARTKNKRKPKSIFFFGTIASKEYEQFKNRVLSASQDRILDDLLSQIHINSQICNRKAKWYNRGHKCLILTVIIWFVIAICKL